ncbi:Microneme protein 13, related [Eimeria necatrix]|uniref:Microneme protein 13, related n=1 Tax=Eimeria necatrix TaxID=51315 RepID=U6N4N0_9EIME|nr:Microneme protein 13, related [Eimeria necatrix]CDJ70249.1 Microneme protein 13, related [Eimeria necatrix]
MKFFASRSLGAAAIALAVSCTASANSGTQGGVQEPPSILHKAMDGLCLETFARACAENPHFCVKAVARRGVGGSSQGEEAWRCYSVKELDFSLSKRACVDDCGDIIECQGAVSDNSLEHLSVTDRLVKLLEDTRHGTCKMQNRSRNVALQR